jgi:hypothetical protein
VTVICVVPLLTPFSVTDVGFALHVVPAGAPLQLTAMVLLNAAMGAKVVVTEPALPRVTVKVFDEFEMLKSGPDPVSEIVCGLFVALSVKVRLAFAFP